MKLKHDPTTRYSGPGAAHVGMFGRTLMLCEEQDRGGGSSGTTGGTGTAAPTGGTPAGGGAANGSSQPSGGDRSYTQADVDRIVGERLARDRQDRGRGGSSGQQQQTPPPRTTTSEPAPTADEQWVFDCGDALDELVQANPGMKPTAAAKRSYRNDYKRAMPENPGEFAKKWFSDMGLVPASSSSSSSTTTTTTTTNNGAAGQARRAGTEGQGTSVVTTPPLSNLGPPNGGPRDFESITEPNDLTADDIDRLRAVHGEAKANQMIRELAERWESKKPRLQVNTGRPVRKQTR